jgi:hypothetical protein
MSMMGLGQAFDWGNDASAFSNYGPVFLYDGTPIPDPANTPATAAQCAPFQCGVDTGNAAAIFWCGYWGQEGFGGAQPCTSPVCAPYKASIPGCNILAPTPITPTPAPPPTSNPPVTLTPVNIVQPLPNITQSNAPVQVSVLGDSCWCQINQWLNDNPLIAAGILAGFALVVLPRKR